MKEEEVKLKTKFDQAKVDVNQNLPATFKVDEARPAERKTYPKRSVLILAIGFVAFVLVLFSLLVVKYASRISRQRVVQKSLQITNKGLTVLAGVVLSIIAVVIAKEWWELLLLPVGMLVVWLTLYRLDWAMWFVVAATPLSVNLTDLTGGSGLSLPTEPMLVMITGLVIIKIVILKEFDKGSIQHPISIAIYVYLVWMLLTVITSQLPLIIPKAMVTRIWFITPYYFFLMSSFLAEP